MYWPLILSSFIKYAFPLYYQQKFGVLPKKKKHKSLGSEIVIKVAFEENEWRNREKKLPALQPSYALRIALLHGIL